MPMGYTRICSFLANQTLSTPVKAAMPSIQILNTISFISGNLQIKKEGKITFPHQNIRELLISEHLLQQIGYLVRNIIPDFNLLLAYQDKQTV